MLLGSNVRFPLLFETLTMWMGTLLVEGVDWLAEVEVGSEEVDVVTAAASTEEVTATAATTGVVSIVPLP